MALTVTVLGMDPEAVEMDQEMEGEVIMEMVEGQGKEEGERVDPVDLVDREVLLEEWEELEAWEAADLTAIVPGMVLVAAMVTAIERERNLEGTEKENH